MAPNVHVINDYYPQGLPPRPRPTASWKDRNCPGYSPFYKVNWAAYSLKTRNKEVLARRGCMWTALAARTVIDASFVVRGAYGRNVAGWAVGALIVFIIFFFLAWCLAQIGEVQGERRVLGTLLGRRHFDFFLFGAALVPIASLIGFFTGLGWRPMFITWHGMWLLIFAAAWITTWAPERADTYV
ncbi:Uu.00g103940.m01.CDS01 [Anthostomella pinea]|uniref:Uu.00g103940.m01.CDS01 n=1 Tax=Anthostomella pinea TaxID=933095 RepID=A0AAI8YFS6_9PEZI|nr:Uu.00g103940.m01.CDS01 [Anthostomella pinea]